MRKPQFHTISKKKAKMITKLLLDRKTVDPTILMTEKEIIEFVKAVKFLKEMEVN